MVTVHCCRRIRRTKTGNNGPRRCRRTRTAGSRDGKPDPDLGATHRTLKHCLAEHFEHCKGQQTDRCWRGTRCRRRGRGPGWWWGTPRSPGPGPWRSHPHSSHTFSDSVYGQIGPNWPLLTLHSDSRHIPRSGVPVRLSRDQDSIPSECTDMDILHWTRMILALNPLALPPPSPLPHPPYSLLSRWFCRPDSSQTCSGHNFPDTRSSRAPWPCPSRSDNIRTG